MFWLIGFIAGCVVMFLAYELFTASDDPNERFEQEHEEACMFREHAEDISDK